MAVFILFLPLLAALITGAFGKKMGDITSQTVTSLAMVVAAILSWILLFRTGLGGVTQSILIFKWVEVGDFAFDWRIRVDTLSAIMMLIVTNISALVHIYSVGYMHKDPSIPRFMAYLSLFTFFMLALVTSDNLVQLFFGWEGVGLSSYLLIGFWYKKPSANQAAQKAFIVNRVGDVGFALGIFAIFVLFDSVTFDDIFAASSALSESRMEFLGWEWRAFDVIGILLFLGAMGKSAQLGLHSWLPDAMEGPTPVSALIHAATMVTAGIFMVCRLSPIFEQTELTRNIIMIVGASTAFFAATVAIVQNDIKRVIAYSTCSQLGYMFFAAGASAYSAAMFHLTTHAFFKALLFLGAGSVIHAMSGEQDMRKMGGARTMIPFTYIMMCIGSLSLSGIPFFAGYYSKDIILEAVWAQHTPLTNLVFWTGIIVAGMTAFYSIRLLILTFHGKPRLEEKVLAYMHEAPLSMTIPLGLLAVGAIFTGIGFYDLFVGDAREAFWQGTLYTLHDPIEAAHRVPDWVKKLPIFSSILGLFLAWILYQLIPTSPRFLAWLFRPLYQFLIHKWYFDELYHVLFVRPSFLLGQLFWKKGDKVVIDGFGPDGVAKTTLRAAQNARRVQSGYLYHYAFSILTGLVVFSGFFIFFLLRDL